MQDQLTTFIAQGIIIGLLVYSIILHEIAHAYAAYMLGDPTGKLQGRLSLNPIVHIDPFQTLLLPVLTYLSFGFPFGGAKPVPINPLRFRNMGKGMMLSAAVGPLTNLTIMLVFGLLTRLASLGEDYIAPKILAILWYVGFLNFILAIFNLLPVPPLDGSRILRYFLPRDAQRSFDSLERYGIIIVLVLVMVFRRQLSVFFSYYVAMAFAKLAGYLPSLL